MTLDLFFDYLGVRLNGPKAANATAKLNFDFGSSGGTNLTTRPWFSLFQDSFDRWTELGQERLRGRRGGTVIMRPATLAARAVPAVAAIARRVATASQCVRVMVGARRPLPVDPGAIVGTRKSVAARAVARAAIADGERLVRRGAGACRRSVGSCS